MMWKRQVVAVVAVVAVVFLTAPLVAANDSYDDFEDTHPLRLVAYPVHGVGYVLEWLVTRPIHALVSQRDLEPILGHDMHPFNFDEQMRQVGSPAVSMQTAAPPVPVDSGASRRALEEAQAAADEARAAAGSARMAAEDAARSAEIADRVADKSTQSFEESLKK